MPATSLLRLGCAAAGEGFLGHRLVELLVERYPQASVASLDIVQRHFPEKKQWTFYSADLTALDSLAAAFKQHSARIVFHTASPWTGSGKEVCEKVNVDGTRTVVEACVQEGVERLVFTSSAGTVYDGFDLVNVDERMPFPGHPLDAYNETKVGRRFPPCTRGASSELIAPDLLPLFPRHRPRRNRLYSKRTARMAF